MASLGAVDTILRWRSDPVAFVRENFELEPDLWQCDALAAAVDHERIAMRAGGGDAGAGGCGGHRALRGLYPGDAGGV